MSPRHHPRGSEVVRADDTDAVDQLGRCSFEPPRMEPDVTRTGEQQRLDAQPVSLIDLAGVVAPVRSRDREPLQSEPVDHVDHLSVVR